MRNKLCSYVYKSQRGDIKYWYFDIGTDKTLVFLHGLTANHHLFDKQVEFFIDKVNCLVWDAPLHGESKPYVDFSYANAAEDLFWILNEQKINKPILIGQSMGGYVAQSFIAKYPDMVRAFVSVDSTPYGEKYYSKFDRWCLRQIEWMAGLFSEKLLKRAIAKQCTTHNCSRNNMEQMLSGYSKRELCHLMGIGYAGFLMENQDIDISCPVLLIVGKKDITGKVKKYNEMWSDSCGYKLMYIDDAAHNSNDDRPELVNKAILEFIQSL